MRFLSFNCKFNDEDVEVMEADEEDGEDIVETVEEVDDLCRSIGEGFSSGSLDGLGWFKFR